MNEGLGFYIVTFAIISGLLNIFFMWYIRNALRELLYVSRNMTDIQDVIEIYRAHLNSVCKLDMYYGDETLSSMMAHTKHISDFLSDYEDLYVLVEDVEEAPYGEDFEEERDQPIAPIAPASEEAEEGDRAPVFHFRS